MPPAGTHTPLTFRRTIALLAVLWLCCVTILPVHDHTREASRNCTLCHVREVTPAAESRADLIAPNDEARGFIAPEPVSAAPDGLSPVHPSRGPPLSI